MGKGEWKDGKGNGNGMLFCHHQGYPNDRYGILVGLVICYYLLFMETKNPDGVAAIVDGIARAYISRGIQDAH